MAAEPRPRTVFASFVVPPLLSAIFLSIAVAARAQTARVVPIGSTWKFLDDGSNAGSSWRAPAFDDSGWEAGPAQLGYGDGDERTIVGFGPDLAHKYITTYFRHSFDVADASVLTSVFLRVLRDDGAVVYLNGSEIFRTNMPSGAITFTTLASSNVGGGDESTFRQTSVSPGLLVEGANVLAVEVHQSNEASSDLSFDFELVTVARHVTRSPYLQLGTPDSLVVRWRTDNLSNSRVRFGLAPDALNMAAVDATVTSEHEIALAGLESETTYFYSVGTSTETLIGGDANHFFTTPPLPGTAKPTRIWVTGDSGTFHIPLLPDSRDAAGVRDSYLTFTGSRATDLWLMLGDNAYTFGTADEYQRALFEAYPTLLRKTVLWPAYGNHDAISSDASTQTGPYFENFTLPTSAEAGGVASSTEAYYSFDYGNVHFVCLDSSESDRTGGPMLVWLEADLAATTRDWVIAFWHHPPYTKGTHDSDLESELVEIRENVLPILDSHGVDLVLTGHSHNYERSFLIDGFYATPTTISDGTILDSGSSPYFKPTLGPAPHEGAVYAVVGSSGRAEPPTNGLDHPVMFFSQQTLGSMVLDIDGNNLTARFIDRTCAVMNDSDCVLDSFTLTKGPVPDITVALTSDQSVVPRGGSLSFTLELQNTTGEIQAAALLFFLLPPGGELLPLGSPIPFALPASADVSADTAIGPFPVTTPLGTWVFGALLLVPDGAGVMLLDFDYILFDVF